MSAVETEQEQVEALEEATRPDGAAATRADGMFRYSTYVHVGPGADECEEGEEGTCADPLHFHAWCRLPNKFQHKDIRDKGLAAKARRMRALRDPETDAGAVLEADMDTLRTADPEALIDEIAQEAWGNDYLEAIAEVTSREDYEHIDQDRERYQALLPEEEDKPEEERGEEFKALLAHIGTYLEEIQKQMTAIQEPKREELRAMDVEGLVGEIRKRRIAADGDRHFLNTYNEWEWFIGTLKTTKHEVTKMPHERVWSSPGSITKQEPGTMWGAAPEVIMAVEEAFTDLERALQAGVPGNS